MSISIAPELEAQLRERAHAEGLTAEAYVEQLIREDGEWADEEPLTESDPEYPDTRAAVQEALEQAERGPGRPAEEVFAELRAKHGISR